ncbi:MAG: glycosyltransferase family 4 protein [Verrucomicrobiota bacterium]|nr:glycosyltransferase family 4 protein [Verrucomicrobiota bacterium]
MKLVVFAHVPPPFHGQSFMVKQLLEELQEDNGGVIDVFHVDARLSKDIDDIASVSLRKLFLLFSYCMRAIFLRISKKATHFYYVPAPGLRSAVYRDWIVMLLCRPFYKKIVYHYQAAGVGDWLETRAYPWERWISHILLGRVALSIVLGDYYREDAAKLSPKKIITIPNCCEDPCSDYEQRVKPSQQLRADKANQEGTFRVLYLSLCYREKGLFDLIEAVALVNNRFKAAGLVKRVQLDVAGKFYLSEEETEFSDRIKQKDLVQDKIPLVVYHGFADETKKLELFSQADVFSLPSYYGFEAHPVCLVEAMAFGLQTIATRWRILPDLYPENYEGLVDIQAPEQIADQIERFFGCADNTGLRDRYLQHFTRRAFGEKVRAALMSA